jgi:hypothetical protein
LNNPNDSEDNCTTDNESDIEQNNCIENLNWPEQHDLSGLPHVAGLAQLSRNSNRVAGRLFVTVNAKETRRYKGVKNK